MVDDTSRQIVKHEMTIVEKSKGAFSSEQFEAMKRIATIVSEDHYSIKSQLDEIENKEMLQSVYQAICCMNRSKNAIDLLTNDESVFIKAINDLPDDFLDGESLKKAFIRVMKTFMNVRNMINNDVNEWRHFFPLFPVAIKIYNRISD